VRYKKLQDLVASQHGVVTRAQLLELGFSSRSVQSHIARRQFFPIWRGVYAVGRPQLTAYGYWKAAIFSCGSKAVLSHISAGNLWQVTTISQRLIDVSVPAHIVRRRRKIKLHRREVNLLRYVTQCSGIPVMTVAATLVDLAAVLPENQLIAAINEADKRNLIDVRQFHKSLNQFAGQPGVSQLRKMLDGPAVVLTESELERMFLRLVQECSLPPSLSVPKSGIYLNGFKVDFFWPDLGLVVETDGLRYHRTPFQQTRDRLRDQVHTSHGLTTLRFTHAQVKYEPAHVKRVLLATIKRLASGGSTPCSSD
jgi:hypothetical protein